MPHTHRHRNIAGGHTTQSEQGAGGRRAMDGTHWGVEEQTRGQLNADEQYLAAAADVEAKRRAAILASQQFANASTMPHQGALREQHQVAACDADAKAKHKDFQEAERLAHELGMKTHVGSAGIGGVATADALAGKHKLVSAPGQPWQVDVTDAAAAEAAAQAAGGHGAGHGGGGFARRDVTPGDAAIAQSYQASVGHSMSGGHRRALELARQQKLSEQQQQQQQVQQQVQQQQLEAQVKEGSEGQQ